MKKSGRPEPQHSRVWTRKPAGRRSDGGRGRARRRRRGRCAATQEPVRCDDQIARPTEAAGEGRAHREDEEHLARRRARRFEPLALLARTRDAESPVGGSGQAVGEGEGGPGAQPVVDVLIGEPPEGADQRDQQQGLLAVDARCATGACGQGGRQRRWARRTARPQRSSRCSVVTRVRAMQCRARGCFCSARWYDGGGTGAVLPHGTGTMG